MRFADRVVVSALGIRHEICVRSDEDPLVIQRGDIGDRLQAIDDDLGLIGIDNRKDLGDGGLSTAGPSHHEETGQVAWR